MKTSWLTTLVGCIGAVATAVLPLLKTGTVDANTLITSIVLALLGIFAKDYNVTGTGK